LTGEVLDLLVHQAIGDSLGNGDFLHAGLGGLFEEGTITVRQTRGVGHRRIGRRSMCGEGGDEGGADGKRWRSGGDVEVLFSCPSIVARSCGRFPVGKKRDRGREISCRVFRACSTDGADRRGSLKAFPSRNLSGTRCPNALIESDASEDLRTPHFA